MGDFRIIEKKGKYYVEKKIRKLLFNKWVPYVTYSGFEDHGFPFDRTDRAHKALERKVWEETVETSRFFDDRIYIRENEMESKT